MSEPTISEKTEKQVYYMPEFDKHIEATSIEEAVRLAKGKKVAEPTKNKTKED